MTLPRKSTFKVLFVTHDTSIYGASRSMQALIRELGKENVYCEMVVKRSFTKSINLDKIKQQFRVGKAYSYWLPFWNCYVGREMTTSLKGLVSSWLSNLLSNITRYKIVKIAQQGNFDVIHLNSLVLFPLADSRFPFVVHVRELIDSDFKNVLPKYVKEARGIIFIDDVVAEPFEKLTIPYRLVLANPFNLLNQNEMQLTKAHLEFLERIRDKFVIAIVGRVTVEKGIAFLLKFLSKFPDPRINLVVVGDGEMLFSCEQFALKDKRLIVLGEQENVSFIYKHADLVVRGDDIPRVGRTVYEAVLSGACVLLPGVSANYPSDLLERFPEQVLFYQTRSVGDFTSRVEELLAREKKRAKDGVAGGGYEVNSLLEFYREASVHSIN